MVEPLQCEEGISQEYMKPVGTCISLFWEIILGIRILWRLGISNLPGFLNLDSKVRIRRYFRSSFYADCKDVLYSLLCLKKWLQARARAFLSLRRISYESISHLWGDRTRKTLDCLQREEEKDNRVLCYQKCGEESKNQGSAGGPNPPLTWPQQRAQVLRMVWNVSASMACFRVLCRRRSLDVT